MAFKFSTGLRNALLGAKDTITAITLSTTATDTISDSGNALLTTGFRPGDTLTTSGWTDAANNGICTVTSVASDGSSMVIAGLTLTTEAAGDSVTITANSKGMKDIFANNVVRIYSTPAPADANAAETGTLLLELSLSSGAVVAGTSTNGNNFDTIVTGVLAKDANVWSDAGLSDGTAVWWRMYDNGKITGLSSTAKRCDGSCGTSGTEFVMSSTTVVTGATVTLDTFNITQPAV